MTHRNLRFCVDVVWIAAVLFAAGCHRQELPKQPPRLVDTAAKASDTGAAIQKAADTAATNIDGATVEVNEVSGTVTTQAQVLRDATPAAEPVAKVLDAQAKTLQTQTVPKLHTAKDAVAEVSKQATVVNQVIVPDLKKADAAVQAVAKERDSWQAKAAAAEKRVEEEKAKAASTTQAVLTWMIVIGVLFVAGGAFLAIRGDLKMGLSICGGGLVLIGTCTFMKEYLDWIVWGSVGLVAAVIAGVLYLLWQSRTAFFQTGNLVEAIKQQMDPESVKAIFGDGAVPGLVHQIVDDTQSALYKLGVQSGLIKTKKADGAAAATAPAVPVPTAAQAAPSG